MKNVTLIISGAPEHERLREATIEPGARAIDLLNALRLPRFLLSKEGSGQFFAAEEPIYEQIESGAKLRATPEAIVGCGFWQSLLRALFGGAGSPAAPLPVGLPPTPTSASTSPTSRVQVLSRPGADTVRGTLVKADTRPLWQLRGWSQEGDWVRGAFRTAYGSFVGEIDLSGGRPAYFVVNPPQELLSSPHGNCFRPRGGSNRFWIHFTSQPSTDIDSGLVAVEGLIAVALKTGKNGRS